MKGHVNLWVLEAMWFEGGDGSPWLRFASPQARGLRNHGPDHAHGSSRWALNSVIWV